MHTAGIHHVTAMAGAPQQNIDFYTGVLGLRLVKVTVNQDDPGTYHFFYGDAHGSPGADMTFFPFPSGRRGSRGAGQVTTTAFAVPSGALEYWVQRLSDHEVRYHGPFDRFGEQVLTCLDPDGLRLELVEAEDSDPSRAWTGGPVTAQYALRGFFGITLELLSLEPTAGLLTDLLGFQRVGEEDGRVRFKARGDDGAGHVDVEVPEAPRPGNVAVGSVHHVAWRAAGDKEQRAARREIQQLGLPVSEVIDRYYFRSIYFREPGGVLFEIATDDPGFTVDQPVDELGNRLVLPPFLEPHRPAIEAHLPKVNLPR